MIIFALRVLFPPSRCAAMIAGARVAAAVEVLADIEARRRPAADALKDWGLAHRFAGSKDRSAIGALVFDALRRRASAAFLMDSDDSFRVELSLARCGWCAA